MKRPLQLPLAIALALGATNVLALGLGPVHVKSKLNQPLDAEIPVIEGAAHDADGLLVTLAGADDFERVGLSRSRLGVPLEFTVVKNAQGGLVIKVTSKEPVRAPYLDFLVEANWTKGRLLREYTVLLDPPVMAPATGRATTTALAESPGTVTVAKHTQPTQSVKPAAAAAAVKAPPAAVKPVREAAAASKVSKGEYGPVEAGQTLSEVARATREGTGASVNQMMMALLKSNPNAFYKDNINALKRGAILRVPAADEIKAIGSASDAAAQVHAQVEDWRGGRAAPTLVADAGSKSPAPTVAVPAKSAKAAAASSKQASERLELVPPKTGKDSMAMADKPGRGAGSPAATGELKSELARTKEALTAREQETGELKSKVKELEGLTGKNDRLINLKDSEIADLQQKLKQLQEKAAATSAKTATAASTPLPVPTSAKAVEPVPVAATSIAPHATAETKTHESVKAVAPADKKDIWGEAGTASTVTAPMPAGKTAEVKTPASTTPAPAAMTQPVSTSSPLAETPPANAASHGEPASVTPPVVEAPKVAPKPVTAPVVKPVVKPAPVASAPWYERAWVKPAALGAGILLLLGGILGLRKRKAAPQPGRNSIADAFGESPLHGEGGTSEAVAAEEADLRQQLDEDPGNVGLHLELLSLYYAERDIPKFEEQAAQMREHVTDLHQPEWQEAEAMGQELAPDNPLFGDVLHHDDAAAAAHAGAFEDHTAYDADHALHADGHDEYSTPHLDTGHDFDPGHAEPLIAHAQMAAAAPMVMDDDAFTFDDVPPLAPETPVAEHGYPVADDVPALAAIPAAPFDVDDFGDEAIGTKLDLAKAYMDMGDPEGARSMLEEVFAEGSDAQKAEASRLMAEIR